MGDLESSTKYKSINHIIIMKQKLFSLILLSIFYVTANAEFPVLLEDELALVYYMPKTQVAFTIQYDQVQVQPGPFYQYAQRYLGTEDVILESQTYYEITSIHAKIHTVADYNRAYKVHAQRDAEMQLLTLTQEGLLYGYNVEAIDYVPTIIAQSCPQKPMPSKLMPLMEEQLIASSIAKMAEGAAKQIYHIREMRLSILAGDVEHTPADGQAMQLVLDELDQREQELAELFIGRKQVTHLSHTIYFTPDQQESSLLTRFSRFAGVVDANDLSGEPIYLHLTAHRHTLRSAQMEYDKKALQPSQIYYNLPGHADITITYKGQNLLQASYPIAQYGVAIPLAKDLFVSKSKPIIYFNTNTGNISSIQK